MDYIIDTKKSSRAASYVIARGDTTPSPPPSAVEGTILKRTLLLSHRQEDVSILFYLFTP